MANLFVRVFEEIICDFEEAASAIATVDLHWLRTLISTNLTLPPRIGQLPCAKSVVPVLALQSYDALHLGTHTTLVVLHWLALLPIDSLIGLGIVDWFCEGTFIYINL